MSPLELSCQIAITALFGLVELFGCCPIFSANPSPAPWIEVYCIPKSTVKEPVEGKGLFAVSNNGIPVLMPPGRLRYPPLSEYVPPLGYTVHKVELILVPLNSSSNK